MTVQLKRVIDLAALKDEKFRELAAAWGLGRAARPREGGVFHGAGFPVLYLPYETLRRNASLWDDAAALLGLRATAPPAPVFAADRTVKRVRRTHREMIANYAEVEAGLRAAKLEWLLEDEAD